MLVSSSICAAKCGDIIPIRPLDSIASQTNALLYARDFKKLDTLAAEYQSPTALATDGQPKQVGFYDALKRGSVACREDQGSDSEWDAHRKLLGEWSRANPQSLAPKVAAAALEHSFGWKARGGGLASTVGEQGWKLFAVRVEKSRQMLEALKPKALTDPGWYVEMLDIAVSQGWEPRRFDQLYGEAVGKFPYYLEIYFTKARFYSRKWYGTPQIFQAFVEETVAATESRMGQTMYARLYWGEKQPDMFKSGQADWKRMKKGYERIMADFPDMWNLNKFARMACMALDIETNKALLAQIKDNVIEDAWGSKQRYDFCVVLTEYRLIPGQ